MFSMNKNEKNVNMCFRFRIKIIKIRIFCSETLIKSFKLILNYSLLQLHITNGKNKANK